MPQTKLQVTGMQDKSDAKKLIEIGETVANVKLINANFETGVVVVTHGDGFDEVAFKAAVSAAGFSV